MGKFDDYSQDTLFDCYTVLLNAHKNDDALIRMVHGLLDLAINEVCLINKCAKSRGSKYSDLDKESSLETLISEIDKLANDAIKYYSGLNLSFCSRDVSYTYYMLNSSCCINCVLFSMFFRQGHNFVILLDSKYLNEYDWKSLKDLLPHSNIRHISIIIEDNTDGVRYGDMMIAKVWDVVLDEYYAIIRKEICSYDEQESGYIVNISVYSQEFQLIPESKKMTTQKNEWLSRPKLSMEEASKEFWEAYDFRNAPSRCVKCGKILDKGSLSGTCKDCKSLKKASPQKAIKPYQYSVFELERFDIYRGRHSDDSLINKEDDDEAREMFRKCLLSLDRYEFVFAHYYGDDFSNDTGYEWYVLKDRELEKAVVLLKDILEWERKHRVGWISGNLYKGDHVVIRREKCIIRCDESCMPLKGTDEYERIKKMCEDNDFLIFSDKMCIDLFTGQKYMVDEYSYPGMADDAATYARATMCKIEGRVLDFESERKCRELKYKWRTMGNVRFAYQKAYGNNEIKDELIRLEKVIEDEMISEYNVAMSSADSDVKNILKRSIKNENESDYYAYEELSDSLKEKMLIMLSDKNLLFGYPSGQKEIIVDLSDNVERNPGFSMIRLINSLEGDEERDTFRDNKWTLIICTWNGKETLLSQWEKLILILYPWIEQVKYGKKEDHETKKPKAVFDKNEKENDVMQNKKSKLFGREINKKKEKTILIYILLYLIFCFMLLYILSIINPQF